MKSPYLEVVDTLQKLSESETAKPVHLDGCSPSVNVFPPEEGLEDLASKLSEMSITRNPRNDLMPVVAVPQKKRKLDASSFDEQTSSEIELLAAASGYEEGALEQIKKLILDGVNVNFASLESGTTALHLAVLNEQIDIIQVLIEEKANPRASDHSGETPLEMAVRANHSDIVWLLLQAAGPKEESVIEQVVFTAAKYGHIELLHFLCLRGVSLRVNAPFSNGETLLSVLVQYKQASAIRKLKDLFDGDGLTVDWDQEVSAQDNQRPIILAIYKGDSNVVRALADAGADLSIDCNLPAHFAVVQGMLEIVQLLHKRGVVMDSYDAEFTPLHSAIRGNQWNILQFFRKVNLNFDVPQIEGCEWKFTPLQEAIQKNNNELVRWLLEEVKVSPSGQSDDGDPSELPVILAIKNDNPEALKYLLAAGLDLAEDHLLRTAIDSMSTKCLAFLATRFPVDVEVFYEFDISIFEVKGLHFFEVLRSLGFDMQRPHPETGFTMTHQCLNIGSEISNLEGLKHVNFNNRNRNGRTPLHLAVISRSVRLTEILLKIACEQKNVDVYAVDNFGETPLHTAFRLLAEDSLHKRNPSQRRADIEIINKFLNAGVSTNIIDKAGRTPLDMYPGLGRLREAQQKAIDIASARSGNNTAETKTAIEENTCRSDAHANKDMPEVTTNIDPVPKPSRVLEENNPSLLMQFLNSPRLDSSTKAASLEESVSNKASIA